MNLDFGVGRGCKSEWGKVFAADARDDDGVVRTSNSDFLEVFQLAKKVPA